MIAQILLGIASLFQQLPQQLTNSGLPLVCIETVNGETPTCTDINHPVGAIGSSIINATKVPGRVVLIQNNDTLYDSGEYVEDKSGMVIQIRGNTSAHLQKRPYKLKLQKKADLLRRGDKRFKDKTWLLLNFGTQLNTLIGLKVNELMGLQWTPSFEFVNVILNGDYQGVYTLCESVKRNQDCRLDVSDSGYVFEFDPYWWLEDVCVPSETDNNAKFTFKYPDADELTDEQMEYFRWLVAQIDKSFASGTYSDWLDVESFASWSLAHDILGSYDGHGSNLFLTKYDNTPGTKVMMANLWDFDVIMMTENDWARNHYVFYFKPMLNSPCQDYLEAYVRKWDEVSPWIIREILNYLDEFSRSKLCKDLSEAILMDDERWSSLYGKSESVEVQLERAREWFTSRQLWLDEAISSERRKLNTTVMPVIANTIPEISDSACYDITGVRANNGNPMRLYIKGGRKYMAK